jgi:anti-sigma-K factor RskA
MTGSFVLIVLVVLALLVFWRVTLLVLAAVAVAAMVAGIASLERSIDPALRQHTSTVAPAPPADAQSLHITTR